MVLEYDPSSSYFGTALRWSFTVVPFVVGRLEFWVFMALHLSVTWAFRNGYIPDADQTSALLYIDWNDMRIISGITTFFLVFFTNQTFSRYLALYDRSRRLIKLVLQFCFETSLHLKSPNHVRLACRYFLASMILFFRELGNSESSSCNGNFWRELESLNLIRSAERLHLETYHEENRSIILLHWAGKVVSYSQKNLDASKKAAPNIMKQMCDILVVTHGITQEMLDTLRLPIPFQYFHLLNLMLVVNLLLWAYGMGVSHSVFAPVVYFFAALIFMGMMELATQLTNPFGEDDTDFPMRMWVVELMENSVVLCESNYPGEKDGFNHVVSDDHIIDFENLRELFLDMMSPEPLSNRRASIHKRMSEGCGGLQAPVKGNDVPMCEAPQLAQ
jgi:predicted membrane chloride channel (bestrophin family)